MRVDEKFGEALLNRIAKILDDPKKAKKFKDRLRKNKNLKEPVDKLDAATDNLKKTMAQLADRDPELRDILDYFDTL